MQSVSMCFCHQAEILVFLLSIMMAYANAIMVSYYNQCKGGGRWPPGDCCLAAQEWPLPKCSFFCPLWLTKLVEIGQGCSWTWSDLSDNGVWSNDGLLRRNSGNVILELLVSCYIIVPDCPGIVHRPVSAYWPSHSELAVFIYLDTGVYSTE